MRATRNEVRSTLAAARVELCLFNPLIAFAILAACDLTEVTPADAEDVVVAEIVLRTDASQQFAFLHRTLGTGEARTVPGARIEVRDLDSGARYLFIETAIDQCVEDANAQAPNGTCYRTSGEGLTARPGGRFALRIDLAGGGTLEAATTVPGDFRLLRPVQPVCQLEAERTIEIAWTASAGAWVYVSESKLAGLRAALRARGIELKDEPARFIGLSIGASDTTLVFPTELGLFDRADPDVAEALLAIRGGLPAGVAAEIVVAATDRNYVNWVRGGQFNPSGVVQVASVRGAGTGVFGSIVVRRATLLTTTGSPQSPPCI